MLAKLREPVQSCSAFPVQSSAARSRAQLRGLGGLAAGIIGMCSLALLASCLTRHVGGASALVLGYIVMGEGMIQAMLRRIGERGTYCGQYLPAHVVQRLTNPQSASHAASRNGRE